MSYLLAEVFDTASPVAFVTGSAANRVGRRIGEHLLEHGFRVAFHSHQGDAAAHAYVDQLATGGQPVTLCSGALQDEANAARWLDEILQKWQRVDLLVNSAAVWEPTALETMSAQDLLEQFQVNTLGSFLTAQKFGLAMTGQPSGGSIVQIGDWAVERPYTGFSSYFVSKGSIDTLVRSLAVELATRNPRVRVNAVMPGPVMLADGLEAEHEQRILDACLLRRLGSPRDVAHAVYFLATSPFVTGVCLPVDGGRRIYAGPNLDRLAHPQAVK